VVELVVATAAELRAGRMPSAALAEAAAAGPPELAPLACLGHGDEDVPSLLRSLSRLPGAQGLRGVASCWQVAEQSGAGLARGLEQVAGGLRDERAVAREVSGQLAGPRATARLLAVLPVFGWVLGAALGAAPVEVLVATAYGWGCLLVGVPLQVAGWWWIERAAAALDPSRVGVRG
jgi:tight adherence protein B